MQQINIVISGFTPYDGIDVNPAVLVPVALAEYWNDPSQSVALSDDLLQDVSMSVTTVTLPVSFANAWPMLLNAIEQANPDIVIATGLRLFEDNLADVIVCVNKTSADRGSEQLALIVTVVCQVTENTADFRELPFEYIEINLLTEFVGVDDFLAVAYKNLI